MALRDRYGRHPFGQGLLLTRRLVRGGTIHGASDDRAAHVRDDGVTPPDLHATVLHLLTSIAMR